MHIVVIDRCLPIQMYTERIVLLVTTEKRHFYAMTSLYELVKTGLSINYVI